MEEEVEVQESEALEGGLSVDVARRVIEVLAVLAVIALAAVIAIYITIPIDMCITLM